MRTSGNAEGGEENIITVGQTACQARASGMGEVWEEEEERMGEDEEEDDGRSR